MFRTGRPATIARSACATKLNPTPAPVFRNVSLARKAAPRPVFPGRQPSMTNADPATMPAPAERRKAIPAAAAGQQRMSAALKPAIIPTQAAVTIAAPMDIRGLMNIGKKNLPVPAVRNCLHHTQVAAVIVTNAQIRCIMAALGLLAVLQ